LLCLVWRWGLWTICPGWAWTDLSLPGGWDHRRMCSYVSAGSWPHIGPAFISWFFCYCYDFFFFNDTGVWTQSLTLGRQAGALTAWALCQPCFCFLFWDSVLM
jgi:hypothetical protein